MKVSSLSSICETAAFSNFFKKNAKTLRNYLYYRYGNEEHAQDVCQEAFIKLWENCHKVPLNKAKSYIYTIANNSYLNQIAHQKVVLEYEKKSKHLQYTSESPEFILEEKDFKRKLQKAIDTLTEAQRTTFLLHRIEGKKYMEIAEILNISVKAVEKRIHSALVSLKKEIDNIR
jgi:RNA polymerase sigma-70 factor (family 1)